MSRTTIIRTLDCIALFLVAHLAFYGFTGLALWGVAVDVPRLFVLVFLHLAAVFAPLLARDFL